MINTKVQQVARVQPVFHLPAQAGCLKAIGPFSIYRGVLVLWTHQYDARVLTFIDDLTPWVSGDLVAACAHEGVLNVAWADGRRRFSSDQIEVPGDLWRVEEFDARTGAPCL